MLVNTSKKIGMWVPPAALFGAPLLIYLLTCAPTITYGDSGILNVAAQCLGIGHQPGYPLAAVAGHLFTLIPVGTAVRRVNWASAAFAAGTTVMVFLLAKHVYETSFARGAKKSAAVLAAGAAAAAVAFGKTFWQQAVITEVYAVGNFVLVAALYAAVRFISSKDMRWGLAFTFLAGLSLVGHQSSLLWTVICALAMYPVARQFKPPWRALCLGAGVLVLGIAVYIYIPLRANQDPAMNWGDANTAERFWTHISRKGLSGVSFGRLLNLPNYWFDFLKNAAAESSPVVFLAGVAGAVLAWRGRTPVGRLFVALAAATPALLIPTLTLTLRVDQAQELAVWSLPFFIINAVLAGWAFLALFNSPWPALRTLGILIITVAVVVSLVINFKYNDYRDYYYAEDYGANLLRTMAYRGLGVDFAAGLGDFEMTYWRKGRGARPDTNFADRGVSTLADYGTINWDATRQTVDEVTFHEAIISVAPKRPVYYKDYAPALTFAGYYLQPFGLLTALRKAGEPTLDDDFIWKRYVVRGASRLEEKARAARWRQEIFTRTVAASFKIKYALSLLNRGDRATAEKELARAERISYGLSDPLANIAWIYLRLDKPLRAATLFRRAAEAVPRKGVGDDYFRESYAKLLAWEGDAYAAAGDFGRARAAYHLSLKAYPNQSQEDWGKRKEIIRTTPEARDYEK